MDLSNLKIGIVVAEFNAMICERLLAAAISELRNENIQEENITIIKVPGACELPFAAKQMIETEKYAGIITIGAVIKGDTPHFDYVCKMAQEGVLELNLSYDIPVIFGVLTTENIAQALERADETKKNKGGAFARSLLKMLSISY